MSTGAAPQALTALLRAPPQAGRAQGLP
ncbi:hypothetical protein SBRY_110226 [Actinacidiphila bryophytorum]|uniref:Uncharacterized protein n=1 Tax=Actinacidiphila bryophytorum TaxID=1436133 RepID=A0A9W4GY59_9ACTN|nr:hypothetical protein SBRY_110226 [Actinacidiphila bryophytorum]